MRAYARKNYETVEIYPNRQIYAQKKYLLTLFWASGFSYCIPASIKLESMKDLLDRFAEIDSNRDGLVDLEEFAEYLNLPVTRQVKHLFSLYDRVSIKPKFTL